MATLPLGPTRPVNAPFPAASSFSGCSTRCIAPKYPACRRGAPSVRLYAAQPSSSREEVPLGAVGDETEALPSVESPATTVTEEADDGFGLVCPICQTTAFDLAAQPAAGSTLDCPRCGRAFACETTCADLTLTSGMGESVMAEGGGWAGVDVFQTQQVSYIYERGWRQGFANVGFPGPDEEFEMAMDYFEPVTGGTVLDMSCGSGLFTRRFAKSDKFQRVVAIDFSDNMLKQTKAFIAEDSSIDTSKVMLVRADAGRLPFATGSIKAIHAGAALHCWPNPRLALAEMARVLAPGGVFVATTFLSLTSVLGDVTGLGESAVRPFKAIDPLASPFVRNNVYTYWEEDELKEVTASVGLQDFRSKRNLAFIMIATSKPGSLEA